VRQPVTATAARQTSADRPWWAAGVRMHHPNMRDLDVRDMDFDQFVAESRSLHANAVVVSAAGIVAFYPSEIFGHYVSELLQGRDFIGAVTERAHAAGLRVVARVDFAGAREPIFRAHPDWVARDAAGETMRRRGVADLWATCPNSPYRRDGFAALVVRELLSRYPLDGFHVNGGGWPGHCYCNYCRQSFGDAHGRDLPRARADDPLLWARYVHWRHERVAGSFRFLKQVAQTTKPDVFWMGELGLRWQGSFDFPTMAGACTPLLITTGDVVPSRQAVRSWAGLAARYARTVDPDIQPLVNLKVFVKSGGWPRSMVPPDEYRLWAWQALANGAGLKMPVFGTLAQDDRRNLPAIRDAFHLMERHPEVYRDARPIAPVALVWPGRTFDHWAGPPTPESGNAAPATAELAGTALEGMYSALVEEHVPFDVLADDHLTPERLEHAGYQVLVLAGAACLSDTAANAIDAFVRRGGGLLLTGWTGTCDEWGQPRATPALASLSGTAPLDAVSPVAPTAPGLYLAPADGNGAASSQEHAAVIFAGLGDVGLITADGPAPALTARAPARLAFRLMRHRRVLPVEAIDEPIDTGCAGIVLHATESGGRVAMMAVPVDALYHRWRLGDHRRLLGNLVRWCAGPNATGGFVWPVESDAPATVEVTLARNGAQRILHFVNATGPEPLPQVIPVRPGATRVRLDAGEKATRARRLVAGGTLPVTQEGCVAGFDVGELGAYEVVLLDVVNG
jgi:hypothetical protein